MSACAEHEAILTLALERVKRLEEERDALKVTMGALINAFDHVRFCRVCGEMDAESCDTDGPASMRARDAAEALLALRPEGT